MWFGIRRDIRDLSVVEAYKMVNEVFSLRFVLLSPWLAQLNALPLKKLCRRFIDENSMNRVRSNLIVGRLSDVSQPFALKAEALGLQAPVAQNAFFLSGSYVFNFHEPSSA